ncbi:glucose-6-phosphate isomerase family protein [Sunxiuqinia sp. A32]|uniref:glucose-6-phosphate isomerase family protein n=1 Tax=Sunxiuqinia sp. A32 TaxID=3461496 RepID=UPI004045B50A
MKKMRMQKSPVYLNLEDYEMTGEPIINQVRRLQDISGIFKNEQAFKEIDQEQLAYTVQAWMPVPEKTPGGLFFGVSTIYPGKVGNEYFMTKGHFHSELDRAEFYWGIQGRGALILMDHNRRVWAEEVYPGSLHYIGGHIAHRLANTGEKNLIVGACWPSDAGHNYEEIAINGFSGRLVEQDGEPVLIETF